MRRALRILVNALTLLSLVLAIGVAGLWVRSYWLHESITRLRLDADQWESFNGFATDRGGINHFQFYRPRHQDRPIAPLPHDSGWKYHRSKTSAALHAVPHLDWHRVADSGRSSYTRFSSVPWWCLVAVMIVLPSIAGIQRLRRSRSAKRGKCPTCGYDLRVTPDRCPECGAMPAAAKPVVP